MKQKETRGGYRENAKRPLKFGEPTKTISARVPGRFYEEAKKRLNEMVKEFQQRINSNTHA